jgi:CHAD domain-containing protein
MRSALRAFRGLARRRRAAAFDAELRATLRVLGAARDWDTFVQSPLPAGLRRAARRPHGEALGKARSAVRRRQFHSLPGRVLAWARSEPWRKSADPEEPIGVFGARALRRLYAELSRRAGSIDWTDAERRHRVRIRAKRLRYGMDCFAGGFPAPVVEPFERRLQALQEVLGDMNDCRVHQEILKRLSRGGLSRPASDAAAVLASRERGLAEKAAKAWAKLEAQPRRWRREAARARG